jgi:radical SAM protein with 4Fe4S-binding SPASM domain
MKNRILCVYSYSTGFSYVYVDYDGEFRDCHNTNISVNFDNQEYYQDLVWANAIIKRIRLGEHITKNCDSCQYRFDCYSKLIPKFGFGE